MSTPIDDLRAAVEAAAADLRDGAPAAGAAPTLERPRKAELRRLLDERRDAAGARAGRAAARRSPSGSATRCRSAWASGSRASRSPGPGFLNLFLADAWYADALGARAGGRRRLGRRRPRRCASASTSSSCPPTRPARCTSATPATPPTATRWRGCSRSTGHDGRARVLRQRLRLAGRALRRVDPGAGARRGGARGRLQGRLRRPSSRPRSRTRRRADVETVARRAVELMVERTRASLRRFGVDIDVWFSERSLHEARPASSTPTSGSRSWARRTAPRARCGCARPSSATTRTACSSARAATTRTSRPTSPTTRTSASAASTG